MLSKKGNSQLYKCSKIRRTFSTFDLLEERTLNQLSNQLELPNQSKNIFIIDATHTL